MISLLLGLLTFVAVAVVARRVRAASHTAGRSRIRRRSTGTTSDRADRLAVLERGVAAAMESGVAFHLRLRPQLRFVVIERLRRKGIELDTDPRSQELLGPVAWALLRLDTEAPLSPDTAGLTDHEVRALTDVLERIR